MSKDKSKAMDPSIREQHNPEPIKRAPRDAYGLTVLIEEVTDLFPETTYETSGPNEFGVNLSVAFDDGEAPDLFPLIGLIESDPRVRCVDRDSIEHYSMVEFHSSFRTQDSRAPFGLADAHAILSEENAAAWEESDRRLAPDFAHDEHCPSREDGEGCACLPEDES